jgi:hypothetical protein
MDEVGLGSGEDKGADGAQEESKRIITTVKTDLKDFGLIR